MTYPIDFAKVKMAERGIENYTTKAVLIEVPVSSEKVIQQSNDYNVLVNFFTQSGVPNGVLEATNTFLNLNPALANTKFTKYTFLDGGLSIKNNSTTEILYVEFLRLTPNFE